MVCMRFLLTSCSAWEVISVLQVTETWDEDRGTGDKAVAGALQRAAFTAGIDMQMRPHPYAAGVAHLRD